MVIESYAVQTSSQRTFLSVQSTTLKAKTEVRPTLSGGAERENEDRVTISGRVKEMHKRMKEDSTRRLAEGASASAIAGKRTGPKTPSTPEELRARLVELMLEMMTGKKAPIRLQSLDENEQKRGGPIMIGFIGADQGMAQVVNTFSLEHFQYESEQVSYQAQGIVKTADGRTINVDISMYMSREFVSYMNINIETQRPVDPLVINYGGTAASLSGERFMFDLTMNGSLDSLAVLGEGSGFLAVDWNGDGKINDGSELFGPRTGCGFSELRQYDLDRNGWIDERDEIFSKLVVWSRDKDGNDKVFTLKELGIGAIYLGDIATEFSFKDANNQTLGVMRSTSFFLTESGGGGTLSHVDLMV